MKCIFFSDLHIKESGDNASQLVSNLFSHPHFNEATHIYFLGDIFDLLIGEHPEYFKKYSTFFSSLIEVLKNQKQLVYMEGNHDFHIEKSLTSFLKENCRDISGFKYLNHGEIIQLNGKKYYICHGDEVDVENEAFKKWKKIYTSPNFAFLINKILSFRFIEFLGDKVSQNSKKRGKKTFDYKKMREKYISGAKNVIQERKVDGLIGGHTHIQEDHTFSDGTRYLNCGHPLSHHNFLYFDGHEFKFISLKDS